MNTKRQRTLAVIVILGFAVFAALVLLGTPAPERRVVAQDTEASPTPEPTPVFDQEAALAKLREQIKGREGEPAEKVFRNIRSFEGVPAGRLLAIMKFGYARSLGVDCTHCHVPDQWAAETKPAKQIARDMKDMAARINDDLLKNMKSLGGREAVVNCTTCHRGQVKPALNLPAPPAEENTE